MSEADEKEELGADLLSALKGGAGEEPAPPDVLAGFQKKVRKMTDQAPPTVAPGSLQDKIKDLLNHLSSLAPSRELSLAKTKIEEGALWLQQHLHLTKQVTSGQDASHPKEH